MTQHQKETDVFRRFEERFLLFHRRVINMLLLSIILALIHPLVSHEKDLGKATQCKDGQRNARPNLQILDIVYCGGSQQGRA